MAYNNNSIPQTMTYMYVAFAHLTDGTISEEEWGDIGGKVWSWLDAFEMDMNDDGVTDAKDVCTMINDNVLPFYNSMDNDGRVDEFVRIANLHKCQDWYSDEWATDMLNDMKGLAMADGNFHENEGKWLDALAEMYGVTAPA